MLKELEGLTCHTGTITSIGKNAIVEFRDNQKLRTCFMSAVTQFINPVDNQTVFNSLRKGSSVNVWLNKSASFVNYASVNWN